MSTTDRSNRANADAAAMRADAAADSAWHDLPRETRDAIRVGQLVRERQQAAGILANVAALQSSGVTPTDLHYRFPALTPSGGMRRDAETGEPIYRDAREVIREADALAVKGKRYAALDRYRPVDPDRMTGDALMAVARKAAWLELANRTGKGWRLSRDERAERVADLTGACVVAAMELAPGVARPGEEHLPRWSDAPGDVTNLPRDRWVAFFRNVCKRYLSAELDAAADSTDDGQTTGDRLQLRRTTDAGNAERAADVVAAIGAVLRAAGHAPLGRMEAHGLLCELDGLTHRARAERAGETLAVSKNRAARGREVLRRRWATEFARDNELRAALRKAGRTAAAAELAAAADVRRNALIADRWGTAWSDAHLPAPAAIERAEHAAAAIRTAQESRSLRRPTRAAMEATRRAAAAELADIARIPGHAADAARMAADIRDGWLRGELASLTGGQVVAGHPEHAPARVARPMDLSGATYGPDVAATWIARNADSPRNVPVVDLSYHTRPDGTVERRTTVHPPHRYAARPGTPPAPGEMIAAWRADLDALRAADTENRTRTPLDSGNGLQDARERAARARIARRYPDGIARWGFSPYNVTVIETETETEAAGH